MEARVWYGHWWLPESADERIPGVLHVNPDGAATLELVGGFDLTERTPLPHGNGFTVSGRTAPIVLGESEGTAITLLDCFTRHARGGDPFRGAPAFHRLHVNRALIGVHLSDRDEPVFRSARLQIENLTTWLGADSVQRKTNFRDGTAEAHLTRTATQTVRFAEWTYKVSAVSSPFQLEERRDSVVVQGDVTAYLWLTPDEPAGLEGYDRLSGEITDLLTLASGVACGLIDYTLIFKDDERWADVDGSEISKEVTVEVIGRRVHTADPAAPARERWKFRFTCHDLPFTDLVAAWLPLARTASSACDVYFGAYYAPPAFTDTKVLFAAISAESLHAALYPDATSMPPGEFAAFRERVREALAPADRARLERVLFNSPSLKERLLALANEPAPTALQKVVADVEGWARDLKIARNGMAHGGSAIRTDLFRLARRSMSVIALVMMARLGLAAEVQVRAADQLDD